MLKDYFSNGWREYYIHESNDSGMIDETYVYNSSRGTFPAILRPLSANDTKRLGREYNESFAKIYTNETGILTSSILRDPSNNFYAVHFVQDVMTFGTLIQIEVRKILESVKVESLLATEDGRTIITEDGRTILIE